MAIEHLAELGWPESCQLSPLAISPSTSRPTIWIAISVCLALAFCAALPGCSGCWQSGLSAKNDGQQKRNKKKKLDFEIARPKIQPSDKATPLFYVKPGHWTSVTQKMTANNFNFTGELFSASTDSSGAPIPLDRTSFRMTATRPAALPKGQTKHFEMMFYIPHREGKSLYLTSSLRMRHGGREVHRSTELSAVMKPFHFFFVVLARQPDTYRYVKAMDSMRPPFEAFDDTGRNIYYHVIFPEVDRRAPLPDHSLAWTNIAGVLWDDFDILILTPGQQQALVDWLHWGGQLIVSGPRSLDGLKNSFLESYLPAKSTELRTLDQVAFKGINDYWSLAGKRGERLDIDVIEGKPVDGIQLELTESGQFVPHTGRLVAERHVGRGRVVVTAFPLTHRQLITWRSYDSFFNGCLLRHPSRRYEKTQMDGLQVTWADFRTYRQDPRMLSSLRYFSRDASAPTANQQTPLGQDPDPGHQADSLSGVAGWTDFSPVASAARESLKEAAGINVPESSFVLLVLFAYLIVLVPVNWGLFHALGRVEWAWIMAPFIAIACAVIVVKLAQLDIGFARSRTEVALLEIQADYSRAHLSRYTALYSSLSTTYTLEFDDESALALPFSRVKDFRMVAGQSYGTVKYHRAKGTRLSAFKVDSNSTGMVHSEQLIHLNGPIALKGNGSRRWSVANETEIQLRDVGVIRRTESGRIQVAWVGDFAPKVARRLIFGQISEGWSALEEWEHSSVTAIKPEVGEVSLRRMLDIAQNRSHLLPGDMRLIGWTDHDLPGMSISPSSSQSTFRTLVVAHLQRGTWPDAKPDVHAKPKVKSLWNEIESL